MIKYKNNQHEIGKYFEREALTYLKKRGFKDISWVSNEKPTSHYDITAKKNNKLFYIEVRYTKSKKFQITEKKLNALKKLNNVLFLLISPEKKKLIPLEEIDKKEYVSINKGFINNLEIKKRKIEGDRESLLIKFINSPRIKIIDFLLDNKPFDFSKEEISRHTGLSKSIYKYWKNLEKYNIVRVTRRFGKTKLYVLNINNPITKKILELESSLIQKAMEQAQKKPILIPA